MNHASPSPAELRPRTRTPLRCAALASLLGLAAMPGCGSEVSGGGTETGTPCQGPAPICPAEGCTGDASFVARFHGGSGDGANAIAVNAAGQVVVGGVTDGPVDLGGGPMEAGGLLAKLGLTGTTLWAKTFPGAEITAVAFDAAGGLVVGGSREAATDLGGGPLFGTLFVAAFDAEGSHVWSRAGVGSPELADLAVDAQGNIAFVAETAYWFDFGTGKLLPEPVKPSLLVGLLDPTGTPVWMHQFAAPEHGYSGAWFPSIWPRVAVDSTGAILVTGEYYELDLGLGPLPTSEYGAGVFVAKLSPSGDVEWNQGFVTEAYTGHSDIAVDGEDNILLTGSFPGDIDFGGGVAGAIYDAQLLVAKFDPDGHHVWSKGFATPDHVRLSGTGIAADASGNVVVTGRVEYGGVDFGGGALTGPGLSGDGLFVVKLGPCGVHIWSKMVADSPSIPSSRVAIGGGGEIWAAGACEGPLDFGSGELPGTAWNADVYVARLAP